LRNERFYRGYRDRAGPPRSCIITPLLSDGLLYIRSPCVCTRGRLSCLCARCVGHTKARLRNYSPARPPPPDSIKTPGVSDRRPPPVRYQIIRWNFYGEEGKRRVDREDNNKSARDHAFHRRVFYFTREHRPEALRTLIRDS